MLLCEPNTCYCEPLVNQSKANNSCSICLFKTDLNSSSVVTFAFFTVIMLITMLSIPSKVYSGGIGSYALITMLIAFLQVR